MKSTGRNGRQWKTNEQDGRGRTSETLQKRTKRTWTVCIACSARRFRDAITPRSHTCFCLFACDTAPYLPFPPLPLCVLLHSLLLRHGPAIYPIRPSPSVRSVVVSLLRRAAPLRDTRSRRRKEEHFHVSASNIVIGRLVLMTDRVDGKETTSEKCGQREREAKNRRRYLLGTLLSP